MVVPPYADAQDVAAIWRPLSAAETVVVEARIMMASRYLARRVRQSVGSSLDDLVDAGSLDMDDVRDLVAEMVLRAVSRPGYLRQEMTTVDDGSISRTYDASVSDKAGVFVTDAELADLLGPVGKPGSGAFTIVPGDPAWT